MKGLSRFFSILILPAFILCYGCTGKKSAPDKLSDFTLRSFMLQDSFAEIQIYVPNELDTFFEWTHVSDNQCDDFRKYRFADKKFSPIGESGSFYDLPDSSYQLTVYHVDRYRCPGFVVVDSIVLAQINRGFKYKYDGSGDSLNLISSVINNYNGRDFTVHTYKTIEGFPNKFKGSYVTACAAVDTITICFQYFTNATDQRGFIERMTKSLETVVIKPNTKFKKKRMFN